MSELHPISNAADLANDAEALLRLARTNPVWHLPGSVTYDELATPWNLAVAIAPLAVVEARRAQDVVEAVRIARRRGWQVTVQATGHGATSPMHDTVLVNTRRLDELHVDAAAARVRAGAGVRWDAVLEACAPHGLAPLAGSAPGVGVVGYTTGGGVGPVARTHGLASDRVRVFQVVTGDGVLRRATPTENPELFWALRGGKGVTGIVTSVEFDVVAQPTLYGGAVYFDGADADAVLRRWSTWSADLPVEATTSVALLRLPPLPSVPPPLAGRLTVAVRFAWTGEARDGERVLEAVRDVAVPVIDTVAVMPYAALAAIHADPVDPMPTHEEHLLLGSLGPDAVDAVLAAAGPDSDSQQVLVELRQLGGALRRPLRGASAFPARHAAYSVAAIGLGAPPVVEAVAADGRALCEALRPWSVRGALPNFATRAHASWWRSTYDRPTLRRLQRISRTYDPAATMLGATDLRSCLPPERVPAILKPWQALAQRR